MRVLKNSNEFFDILDSIRGGQWVTIGYVSGANLDLPKVNRRNPLTNRMKGYPDYSVFNDGGEDEIGALVKITSYNMQYLNRKSVSDKYGEWKNSVNDIRGRFGVDPMASKSGYKDKVNYGKNGIETYKGDKEELQGHSYNPQNVYGARKKSVVYAINQDGHIMRELKPEQVKPYLKQYREHNPEASSYMDSGANALMKMGAEESKIKEYLEQINSLKFRYINFEANSILWIAASVNGEKIVYINDNLARAVDGINIRPEDFRAIARERYKIDLTNLQEMKNRYMNKKVIKLTESDLHRIIENSVKKCIKESFQNNQNYSHFAVNKATNKIVNGWDYWDYDPSELREFKNDYFTVDLVDNDLDPKQYRILTDKYLRRQGIDPNDNANWANS